MLAPASGLEDKGNFGGFICAIVMLSNVNEETTVISSL